MLKKLTSRKLWMAIIGVLIGVYLLIIENNVEKGCEMIIASIIAYLGGESYIDGKFISTVANEIRGDSDDNESK